MNPSKKFWKSFDASAGYKLQVEERDGKRVGLIVYHPDLSTRGMNIPADLAPAVALAILEAAGVDPARNGIYSAGDAGYLGSIVRSLQAHIEATEAKAKEAADREALDKRRNEVANELLEGTISYKMCNLHFQRAIDRIIELEDRAKS